MKVRLKSTCKLVALYLLTGFATYPYITRLRFHVIRTREVDSLLARMFVRVVSRDFWFAFSQCVAKKTLFFVTAFSHVLSVSLD